MRNGVAAIMGFFAEEHFADMRFSQTTLSTKLRQVDADDLISLRVADAKELSFGASMPSVRHEGLEAARSSMAFVVMRHMGALGHQLQVIWAVVRAVAIDVMNRHASWNRNAECLFHHEDVFKHIPMTLRTRMVWHPDLDVSSHCHAPSFHAGSIAKHWILVGGH